jgi:glycosyltransferase involved in cell wall biosynthesis
MQLKKVIILTYWFPPCELTASQRPYSWALNFNKFGYHPIIFTRHWVRKVEGPKDLHYNAGITVDCEEYDGYTIVKIPYKQNLRDKLFTSEKKFPGKTIIQKFLTISELILQNFSINFIPHGNQFHIIKDYILKNKNEFAGLLVTANPFINFKLAYHLNKETGIKWIADYRDDWTTRDFGQWYANIPIVKFLAKKLETHFEKKWVRSSEMFVSVSPHYVNKIKSVVKIKGEVIYNGYIQSDFDKYKNEELFEDFTLCYNGTLLDIQDLTILRDGLKRLNSLFKNKIKVKLFFAGTGFDLDQRKRVEQIFFGQEEFVEITNRLPRDEVIRIQQKCHLLLIVAYGDVKSALPTKLFDYMALRKPVLLCPSDKDIMEEMLKKTGQIILISSTDEFVNKLSVIIDEYIATKKITFQFNQEEANFYTRENQAKKLTQYMDECFV